MTQKVQWPQPPEMSSEFSEKRTEWPKLLGFLDETAERADPNASLETLHTIIHDTMVFRLARFARTQMGNSKGDGTYNEMLYDFIVRSFTNSQIMRIRRLADPKKNGKHAVYMLRGVCEDMREHCALLTRENIFAANNLA